MLAEHSIKFSKMHGLGNDVVVINALSEPCELSKARIVALSDRHTGIGFDQLIVIKTSAQADFACRIFNADGSEAEQCGNGLRCVGRFLKENGLTDKATFSIETLAGVFEVVTHSTDSIQVAMGAPSFLPERIPFLTAKQQRSYSLTIPSLQQPVELTVLSMGNPHAILRVAAIADCPVMEWGAAIASHAAFPQSTNVGFMEIVARDQIRLRTFERGVGETFACGSNACAAVVAGIYHGWLDQAVTVKLAQGDLAITWQGEASPVFMTGPAARSYEGFIPL